MYPGRVEGQQETHKLIDVHRSRAIGAHALLFQNAHYLLLHIEVFFDFL